MSHSESSIVDALRAQNVALRAENQALLDRLQAAGEELQRWREGTLTRPVGQAVEQHHQQQEQVDVPDEDTIDEPLIVLDEVRETDAETNNNPPPVPAADQPAGAPVDRASAASSPVDSAPRSVDSQAGSMAAPQEQTVPEQVDINDLNVREVDAFYEGYRQNSLEGLLQDIELRTNIRMYDFEPYLRGLRYALESEILKMFAKERGINFWVSVQVKYTHPTKDLSDQPPPFLHTGKLVLINKQDLQTTLDKVLDILRQRNVNFNKNASGLVLEEILKARFKVMRFAPLVGNRYTELPEFLRKSMQS